MQSRGGGDKFMDVVEGQDERWSLLVVLRRAGLAQSRACYRVAINEDFGARLLRFHPSVVLYQTDAHP